MAYLVRRKRSWFAQVNRLGVRRSKSFPTRRAAETWAEDLEATIAANHDPAQRVTLGDVIDRYERDLGRLRPWGPAKTSALRTCRKGIGSLTLGELTVEAITEFAVARAIAGIGPATITHDLACLSACLRTARLLWRYPILPQLIQDARTVLGDMRLVGQSKSRKRIIGATELARLERAWKGPIPFDLVRFAAASCMRRGELLALRWSDFNPTFRTILVRDRKHPTAKDGNHQLVPLLGEAFAILERQPRGAELIWPWNPQALYRAWTAAAAGLDDLRFHDLRHTGITAMFRDGWKINEVAIVSGHQSWATLKRYTHTGAADLIALEDARRGVAVKQELSS